MLALSAAHRAALTPATRAAVEALEVAAAPFPDLLEEFNRAVLTPGHSLETGAARALLEEFMNIATFGPARAELLLRQLNGDIALHRHGFTLCDCGRRR